MSVISTENFILKYKHINFQKMARSESCPRIRERLLGFYNLMIGKNRIEAAKAVGRNPEWLRMWVLRYDEGGYENLIDKAKSGQPKHLTSQQEDELIKSIISMQENRNGGRITGSEIKDYIEKKYGKIFKNNSIYDLLNRLGLSWVSSRSKHPKSDEKKQKAFKQTFKARVAQIKTKKKRELKFGFKTN
jgi:transposase